MSNALLCMRSMNTDVQLEWGCLELNEIDIDNLSFHDGSIELINLLWNPMVLVV